MVCGSPLSHLAGSRIEQPTAAEGSCAALAASTVAGDDAARARGDRGACEVEELDELRHRRRRVVLDVKANNLPDPTVTRRERGWREERARGREGGRVGGRVGGWEGGRVEGRAGGRVSAHRRTETCDGAVGSACWAD